MLEKEIEIVNPKVIVLFGNQVSSIVLGQKISVSQCRKQLFQKKINHKILNVTEHTRHATRENIKMQHI